MFVNSPANLAGGYAYTASNPIPGFPPFLFWGADVATGEWQADVVIAESATGLTCDSLVNSAELAGKIAIVDGTPDCQFNLQAYQAQKAGAIAIIVIKDEPGAPTGMGGGDSSAVIVIPVVMIRQDDGALIKAALASGSVNITIGTITFPNDVGARTEDIMRTQNGVMPALQSVAAGASLLPAALIKNRGQNDAHNVTLSVSIDYTPDGGGAATNVHTDANTLQLLEADSSVNLYMDNAYIANAGVGTYSVTYSITSDSIDNYSVDNEFSYDYFLSDNVYAKSGWETATNRPSAGRATTFAPGKTEFLAGFRMPLGVGYRLDSIQFFLVAGPPNMNLEQVGAANVQTYVYDWNDTNSDGEVTNDEIELVAIGFIESFPNPTEQTDWIKMPLYDLLTFDPGYVVPGNDKTYFIGLRYLGSDVVAFGLGDNYNQKFNTNNLPPNATYADLPYLFTSIFDDNDLPGFSEAFYSSGVPYPLAAALIINALPSSTGKVNPEIGSFEVYPNPVSNFLNVEARLAKNYNMVSYTIVNSNGQVMSVITKDIVGQADNVVLNVSGLPAGQYFLNVNTVDGSISKAFVVQH